MGRLKIGFASPLPYFPFGQKAAFLANSKSDFLTKTGRFGQISSKIIRQMCRCFAKYDYLCAPYGTQLHLDLLFPHGDGLCAFRPRDG